MSKSLLIGIFATSSVFAVEFGYGLDRHVDDFTGFKRFQTKFEEDDLLYYARWMVDNKGLYVCDSMDPYCFGEAPIDWNKQDVAIASTFQLYLHGLSSVQVLAYAYECTKERRYLDFAWEIVESWINFNINRSLSSENKRCWMDHTVALRAESLLYFTQVALGTHLDEANFRVRMNELLVTHCAHLADDLHYTQKHNHGIIQDCALLHVAYFVQDSRSKGWIEHAKQRLAAQKNYAFNDELVHVENSPGYNIAIVKIFDEIGRFLSSMNDSDAERFRNEVSAMAEFLAWSYEPNGLLASIGDTFGSTKLSRKNKEYSRWGNRRLAFVTSLGEEPLPEEDAVVNGKYYPKAGYYFYRSNWDANEATNATWKMFKSGFSSRTHKHADDLSFMLYSKGFEIFTDPGMYNYMYGDRFREYFTSASAHNTITVDEQNYSVTEENCWKVGMLSHETNCIFEVVKAFNDMYPGVAIDRCFISSGDLTILYDDIVSSDELHRYRQLFHLSENITILDSSDDMVLLAIANSGYRVRIRQMTPTEMSIHRGDEAAPLYGHISRTMGVVNDGDTLVFERNGVSLEYVTIITIEDDNGNVALQDGNVINSSQILYDSANKAIKCASWRLDLVPRKRFNPKLKSVYISNDDKIHLEGEEVDGGSASFEISDLWTGGAIAEFNFVEQFYSEADLSKFQSDLIVTMKVNKDGQCKKRTICALKFDDAQRKHYLASVAECPNLNLRYRGCDLKCISPSVLRCELEYEYSLNTRQKWYVYRNGSGYMSKVTENQKSFEFDCSEPGRYAVLSFLYTVSGDCEFRISQEVCVTDEDIKAGKKRKKDGDKCSELVEKIEITNDNMLEISIRECLYQVYLVDAKTKTAIYKSGWSDGKTFKCPLENHKGTDVNVRLYIRSKATNERKGDEIAILRWQREDNLFCLEEK